MGRKRSIIRWACLVALTTWMWFLGNRDHWIGLPLIIIGLCWIAEDYFCPDPGLNPYGSVKEGPDVAR